MTLQQAELNRSHQGIRPARIEFDLAANFTVFDQSGGGLDFTAGGTKLTLRQLRKFCDDQDRLSVVGGNVVVPDGLWVVRFEALITKTSATTEAVHFAITDTTGAVVFVTTGQLDLQLANPTGSWFTIGATLTAGTYAFRASKTTAGNDVVVEAPYVGFAERFANPEQILAQ